MKKCVNTRARAFKITNTKKRPQRTVVVLLLVLFLFGVFLLFSIKAREFNLIKERENFV